MDLISVDTLEIRVRIPKLILAISSLPKLEPFRVARILFLGETLENLKE